MGNWRVARAVWPFSMPVWKELAEDQLQVGIATAFRFFRQHIICKGIEIDHGFPLRGVETVQQLLIRQDHGGGIIRIVHACLLEGRFFIVIRVDEPFIRGMQRVIKSAPAGRTANYVFSVVSPDRNPGIQKVRCDGAFDDLA